MTPAQFVRKWAASRGGERAVSQEHFIDLCRLLGEATPNEADPSGDLYAFDKGARKPDGEGFADVWLKDHFAWEYKGKRKDLAAAYKQVCDYREALGNPPLLLVCDIDRFEVHTNWTNTEKWIYRFSNTDLLSDSPVQVSTVSALAEDAPRLTALQVLKHLFDRPEVLKPRKTTEQITREAAKKFGKITEELRKWKVEDMRIARFITRVLFCMFASDVGLLPRETFSEIVSFHRTGGDDKGFRRHLSDLFGVMNGGGEFFMRQIPHFNGRLFEDDDVPDEVTKHEILILGELDSLNWADVEPSIFGTLFERIVDPAWRKMPGVHYTSRADIELIVEPVLMAPLRRQWEEVKGAVEDYLYSAGVRATSEHAQRRHVRSLLARFHRRLASTRVLDPACGSGNFLYVSLALLKALEKEIIAFAALHDITGIRPRVHPRQLYGIEISPYAVELASVVIWIGYLQWKHRNAMPFEDEEPILEPLDQIHRIDAIVDDSDPKQVREADWPEVDVIVGNPPFLGGKMLRRDLGDDYVDKLFAVWDGRVARESDLCCYWLEKARAAIEARPANRVGLLATQAIRGGANRRTLERIKQTGDIFYAQADRKWIQDGVAVRVSMIGFDDGSETRRLLNETPDDDPHGALDRARPVEGINPNLTHGADLTTARRLKENLGISFIGVSMHGPFQVPLPEAKQMLAAPRNVNRRPNSDVVREIRNAESVTSRVKPRYVVYFAPDMSQRQAAPYEAPFEYVRRFVAPVRAKNRRKAYRDRWWIHGEPRPALLDAIRQLGRYIATPRVGKHRIFIWLRASELPADALVAFARDDDFCFGALHSRIHEVWARNLGTQLRESESGFRYSPTMCFETFPFPRPTDQQREAIAEAAANLNRLREEWLNPAPVDGLPLSENELKRRTLTNLYNQRPTWLANAHATLDAAILAAYGWPPDIADADMLSRLLALNLQRDPA